MLLYVLVFRDVQFPVPLRLRSCLNIQQHFKCCYKLVLNTHIQSFEMCVVSGSESYDLMHGL